MRSAERGRRNQQTRTAEPGMRNINGRPKRGAEPTRTFRVPRSTFRGLCCAVVIACSGPSRTPLVIYTPHGRDLLTLLKARYEQLHPGIDIRWLDMGSQEVYDRVRSERANPQADVWFGGPATIFARAAADSLLEPYRPSWAGAIDPPGRGRGDIYFAAYETPVGMVYARRAPKPEDP